MEERKSMKVITFASLKGGTGKTSITLFIARVLAASGYKVLVIDCDINNATSFTLLPSNLAQLDPQGNKHIAAALQSENNLFGFAVASNTPNISIIRSSLYLVDLRTISTNRLKNLLHDATAADPDKFDFVIIDQPPTYDNITLMADETADVIVTPVLLSQFDYNTAIFLQRKLQKETTKYAAWHILLNGVQEGRSSSQDYVNLFQNSFADKLCENYLPWTTQVKNCIDRGMKLGHAKENERLRSAICDFASELTGEEINPPEAF
jgi:chromosome partitioning protein